MEFTRFTDLNSWREGHKLVIMVYTLTKQFPREEVFCFIMQIRRCAVSITSNIVERCNIHHTGSVHRGEWSGC